MAQISFVPSSEVSELSDDVREIFEELAKTRTSAQHAASGECHPALDVFETDSALEIVVDVAGVPTEALRVLLRRGVLLIAGEKAAPAPRSPRAFHLVEREFGRFARGVRVNGAFDVEHATATIRNGELTIVLPKRAERRGAAHRIDISLSAQRPQ